MIGKHYLFRFFRQNDLMMTKIRQKNFNKIDEEISFLLEFEKLKGIFIIIHLWHRRQPIVVPRTIAGTRVAQYLRINFE